jgi:hypothetical protein
MPKAITSSKNLIGATGEYYVCAELCKRGFLALLTPKNNPLFDIVVTNAAGSRSVVIQVKTRSIGNEAGWRFGTDVCKSQSNPNLFTVLVNLRQEAPEYLIFEHDRLAVEVERIHAAYMAKLKKDGTKRADLDFRWYDETDISAEDRDRRNNWEPLLKVLTKGPDD